MGCQNTTLDTSKLEKVQSNLSKEQLKNMPINYKATSSKVALDALPFKMTLPVKLPFESDTFRLEWIQDVKHDGKIVRVSFVAPSKNKEEKSVILLYIMATNLKNVTYSGTQTEVKLAKEITGYSDGGSIYFRKDGILYDISYVTLNEKLAITEEEFIDLANQMIK